MSHGDDITRDAFLDGAITISQQRQGYRAGTDAVFLAAAIPVQRGEQVLDVGSGVGTAGLCVAWRVPQCHMTLLDGNAEAIALAQDNIQRNAMNIHVIHADIGQRLKNPEPQSFHHVMTNPPYFQKKHWFASPHKVQSHTHTSTSLEGWLTFCCRMVRPYGTLTMIHRADHLDLICHLLYGRLGEIVIMPLWPRAGQKAHRVIIQGIKGSKGTLRFLPGICLQDDHGHPTFEAENIARRGHALDLRSV